MKCALLGASLALAALFTAGCATLDAKQREWIFQPSNRSWGDASATTGMQEVWINLPAHTPEQPQRLHGLWLAHARENAPVLLYLHGARWNVSGSAHRILRMQSLGFSVLAIDYRGFGQSSAALPSEHSASEDALAAWQWIAQHHPSSQRYIFGHSLGGAIAIDLARQVTDEDGTLVEGTFPSIAAVVRTTPWGWLPLRPLITQRFASIDKVKDIGSALLVVHGSEDRLIPADLGRQLYDSALQPKQFVLVDGGSHHNTNAIGQAQYRHALTQLFAWPSPEDLP